VGGLARGGRLVVMGYWAGIETTLRVTDLVWKLARVSGFSLFAACAGEQAEAYATVLPLIAGGQIAPARDRSFPLEQAPEALRHGGRPIRPLIPGGSTADGGGRPAGRSHGPFRGDNPLGERTVAPRLRHRGSEPGPGDHADRCDRKGLPFAPVRLRAASRPARTRRGAARG
jgi:zinc-binding alcohol dehydrogenase family protein